MLLACEQALSCGVGGWREAGYYVTYLASENSLVIVEANLVPRSHSVTGNVSDRVRSGYEITLRQVAESGIQSPRNVETLARLNSREVLFDNSSFAQ